MTYITTWEYGKIQRPCVQVNQEWGIIKGKIKTDRADKFFLRPSITFINTGLPKLRVSKATAFDATNSVSKLLL